MAKDDVLNKEAKQKKIERDAVNTDDSESYNLQGISDYSNELDNYRTPVWSHNNKKNEKYHHRHRSHNKDTGVAKLLSSAYGSKVTAENERANSLKVRLISKINKDNKDIADFKRLDLQLFDINQIQLEGAVLLPSEEEVDLSQESDFVNYMIPKLRSISKSLKSTIKEDFDSFKPTKSQVFLEKVLNNTTIQINDISKELLALIPKSKDYKRKLIVETIEKNIQSHITEVINSALQKKDNENLPSLSGEDIKSTVFVTIKNFFQSTKTDDSQIVKIVMSFLDNKIPLLQDVVKTKVKELIDLQAKEKNNIKLGNLLKNFQDASDSIEKKISPAIKSITDDANGKKERVKAILTTSANYLESLCGFSKSLNGVDRVNSLITTLEVIQNSYYSLTSPFQRFTSGIILGIKSIFNKKARAKSKVIRWIKSGDLKELKEKLNESKPNKKSLKVLLNDLSDSISDYFIEISSDNEDSKDKDNEDSKDKDIKNDYAYNFADEIRKFECVHSERGQSSYEELNRLSELLDNCATILSGDHLLIKEKLKIYANHLTKPHYNGLPENIIRLLSSVGSTFNHKAKDPIVIKAIDKISENVLNYSEIKDDNLHFLTQVNGKVSKLISNSEKTMSDILSISSDPENILNNQDSIDSIATKLEAQLSNNTSLITETVDRLNHECRPSKELLLSSIYTTMSSYIIGKDRNLIKLEKGIARTTTLSKLKKSILDATDQMFDNPVTFCLAFQEYIDKKRDQEDGKKLSKDAITIFNIIKKEEDELNRYTNKTNELIESFKAYQKDFLKQFVENMKLVNARNFTVNASSEKELVRNFGDYISDKDQNAQQETKHGHTKEQKGKPVATLATLNSTHPSSSHPRSNHTQAEGLKRKRSQSLNDLVRRL